MKMTPAHYAVLKAKLEPLADKIRAHRLDLEAQHRDPHPLRYPVKNVSTRLIWDAYFATGIARDYTYQEFHYTDAHIETAMRAAFRDLKIDA